MRLLGTALRQACLLFENYDAGTAAVLLPMGKPGT